MEAEFSVRVACETAWTIALISTFGDDSEGETGGAWGAGTVGVIKEKYFLEEATGEVCSHEGSGDCYLEAGVDVMLVGGSRILGSWIHMIASCLFRSP